MGDTVEVLFIGGTGAPASCIVNGMPVERGEKYTIPAEDLPSFIRAGFKEVKPPRQKKKNKEE